ncbi:MAG TPA: capsular polysaccharide biosynthesis protein [Paracoccaceae bacterium]|nr:capsular polysaccharide biosynthesis protein [Paracoccaceae bacterium]
MNQEAGGDPSAPRRLGVLSLGFARQPQVRRILALAGWQVVPGPRGADAIGVWGRRPVARRGMMAARLTGMPLVTIEDAFLRGLRSGRSGEPPWGLVIDDLGIYYDASRPSRLERMLAEDDLPDGAAALALWRELALSKFNDWADEGELPEPGFVLVVDQSPGDAAIRYGAAGPETIRAMLSAALAENPGERVLIRTHPDVARGRGRGHFGPEDAGGLVGFLAPGLAPQAILARASRVYAVSSQLGFEAILAGHRPRLFGLPWYAGWGLADEERSCPRRGRQRTAEELFAAAMLRYAVWYEPFQDRLSDFAAVARAVATAAAAWRANRQPAFCTGMRLWKRQTVRRFLAGPGEVAFEDDPARAVTRAAAVGGRVIAWAGQKTPGLREACAARGVPLFSMEDGFLRSVGLGAALVAPASLVLDDLGIYYDPARPSRLERLIAESISLPPEELARAAALRRALAAAAVTKYNVGRTAPLAVPAGARVILVPGQVEDDAGLLLAAGEIHTNRGLLEAARVANPGAFLLYKPHPDVETGLRPGAIEARDLADAVAADASAAALIGLAEEIWTISSLMGFEALIRGRRVTCLGAPFYAGWGLTSDLGPVPARREARPALDGLVHAALIGYPCYVDPVTGIACAPEVILARLAARDPRLGRSPSPAVRLLSRLQRRFARQAWLWRG